MTGSPTVSFTKNGQSLFSPEEVRNLMEVEFERAKRHRYAITCMMVSVDRLEALHTFHGYDSKETILQAVVDLLKKETRASDFLGCLVDDRLLAVFPHTSAESARFLSKRILDGTRTLGFSFNGQTLRVTASIGLAHNLDGGARTFEVLLRVAEEGLVVADAGGGDKVVETELYELYEEHVVEKPAADAEVRSLRGAEDMPDDPPRPEVATRPPDEEIRRRAAELTDKAVAEAVQKVREERTNDDKRRAYEDRQAEQYKSEIDVLQRRLEKLVDTLDKTEDELARVRDAKKPDDGVASVYSEVQGLNPGDGHKQMKYKLICKIFEANLELQRRLSA